MKSAVYNFKGRKFRYDYDNCLVQCGFIAETEDDIEIFHAKEIGDFIVGDEVGLCKENWDNKEVRDEYLMEYCYRLEEEINWLLDII